MKSLHKFAAFLLAGCALNGCISSPAFEKPESVHSRPAALEGLLDYLRRQKTTGFLVIRDGKTLIEENWPAPEDTTLPIFLYGKSPDGALLEDVASQQKSFVSVLVAQAIDRGLIDPSQPVGRYLGTGWSKASPDEEAAITVEHVLTMSSGLDDDFRFTARAGTKFHYNTPVYAMTKPILEKVTGKPISDLTREWLTEPLDMKDTAWRRRPAALGNVGNATGLVTTPRDIARLGALILSDGVAPDGRRIVSKEAVAAMLKRSPANPAYGRLWWLNGGDFTITVAGSRRPGQLIPTAPRDTIAALGALDRKLFIAPGLKLIVVRTGAAAPDEDFDEVLWSKLVLATQ